MRNGLPTDAPVVVVGGGQAGLSVSHELTRAGVDHMILEADRIGSSWAGLWDSFRLNTPNWSVRLPGLPYDGDEPDDFMTKVETVEYLGRYAATLEAPLHEGVRVTSILPSDVGFRIETSSGALDAHTAIVCTGAYQRAFRPPGAGELPSDLVAVDTRTYRNPGVLPDGVVLVVGNGQSGCQIAEELVDDGREVVLSCGKAAWSPRRIGGHDAVWWALETGFLDQTPDELPSPGARLAANVTVSGTDGGHDLHARLLRDKGVKLAGHFEGPSGGSVRFADDLAESLAWSDARCEDFYGLISRTCEAQGTPIPELPRLEPFRGMGVEAVDMASLGAVIFSGGFRPDFGWIEVPGALDAMGFPVQRDGRSKANPGLFFVGIHFLRTRRSSLLCGVGQDAAVVAGEVSDHLS